MHRGVGRQSAAVRLRLRHIKSNHRLCAASEGQSAPSKVELKEGASTDLGLIWDRLVKLVYPYWVSNPNAGEPRLKLVRVIAFTLMCTGVSVVFNFLGRDFFNALSAKDVDGFYTQLVKYLAGFAVGIPVFVFRDYFTATLSLQWREWMTRDMLDDYMDDRTFYAIQSGGVIDNPDQRLTSDINQFTSSFLSLSFTFLSSVVDLVSFSGILFTIYPPLFLALVLYAGGGTAVSFWVGKKLVGLNFRQEAREADLRYGLVRLRENAESIAFYDGAGSETALLRARLGRVIGNYVNLLKASRNLDFFQSAYRYIIILLPAAVVAPLYFQGKIEFGVVNQSQSAFSHILSDVSLIVYQFESLAGFSAVVDRLGQFQEAVEARGRLRLPSALPQTPVVDPESEIELADCTGDELLTAEGLTLCTPDVNTVLVRDLDLRVRRGERVLIMGSSGTGKTSILRALAGLWRNGVGRISRPPATELKGSETAAGIMFVPQKPYMILGTLRQQLLYPVFEAPGAAEGADDEDVAPPLEGRVPGWLPAAVFPRHGDSGAASGDANGAATAALQAAGDTGASGRPEPPSDALLVDALRQVGLDKVLARCGQGDVAAALDMSADWALLLSLGEQQRLAFARVLLARPAVVLLDESTSALDLANEARLYRLLQERGAAVVSVGHRTSLLQFHDRLLRLEDSADAAKGVAWRLESIERDVHVTAGVV